MNIRPPAVAGAFYPSDGAALAAQVDALLADPAGNLPLPDPEPAAAEPPKILIVPHAGYVYSGAIAASAYRLLAPWRETIRRVVLLGPAHRHAFTGIALPAAEVFSTPLGVVPVDASARAALGPFAQVGVSEAAHALEHSLEVQLPFLQRTLAQFTLVPLVVGRCAPQQVSQVIECLWGGPETLILISSDLSHYLPAGRAHAVDETTARAILALDPRLNHEQACGATPVNGALLCAAAHGLHPRLLDLRNSGDTGGDRDRVVGYCSVAFERPAAALSVGEDASLGAALLGHARGAIGEALGVPVDAAPEHPAFARQGATFVTLTDSGRLRGCIGSLRAHRPLREDVRGNAHGAAFRDPRFPALTAAEFEHVRVEVSLLEEPVPMIVASEADAIAQLCPPDDGVILGWNGRSATFLPQVWEQLPEPRAFLEHLKRKAGLPADFWAPDMRLSRYRVTKWKEPVAAEALS